MMGAGIGASLLVLLGASAPDAATSLAIIPWPEKVVRRPGEFRLTTSTCIQAPPALRGVAEWFRSELRPGTGLPLAIRARAGGSRVVMTLDPRLASTLGDEGYRLEVTRQTVEVRAAKTAGVFYGLQTFRQLLPAATFGRAPVADADWRAPAVLIEDRPRFAWRGNHLDVGRHFQPKEFLLKHIDLMALHKLNVFHWHLTEDQGWRLEIKKYPKLTEVGAWRKDSALGPPPPRGPDGRKLWKFRGKAHGGFYTQDDAREVVRYAAERFITVVPEIEMPGHATAALAAYPEFGNTGQPVEVATTWGIFKQVFSPEDRTLAFLQDVLTEVLAIFPSRFIHIGGDEVPKDEWRQSAAAQARMRTLGLESEEQLQSWFVRQMGIWLAARGRRLVGWEEILQGGLAPGATVMAWRSIQPAITAAKQGHDAIMAPKAWTYLDYRQSGDPREPPAIGGGPNPLEKVYSFDPIPADLPPEQAKHILGGQAQLWTEYMPSPKHVEYMAWPRLCALAEAFWSPRQAPGGRNFEDFKQRLTTAHLARLGHLDVNYRPLDGPWPAAATIP
jgi:hexosaminidase